MATTSPNNIRTPDLGDPYNLVPDLQTLANDVQDALTERANSYTGTAAQRVAFAASAPDGALWVDTDDDKHVWRNDGGTWVRLVPDVEDTGWIPISPVSGYTGNGLAVRRIGDVVSLRGRLTKTSGGFEDTLGSTLFTIPAGMRSPVYFRCPVATYNGTAAGTFYLAIVEGTGTASAGRMGSGSGADLYFGGVTWMV